MRFGYGTGTYIVGSHFDKSANRMHKHLQSRLEGGGRSRSGCATLLRSSSGIAGAGEGLCGLTTRVFHGAVEGAGGGAEIGIYRRLAYVQDTFGVRRGYVTRAGNRKLDLCTLFEGLVCL
jgi:hypothetical protein